nr:unnamed protein product [Callosobruchus chinensis]
MVEFNALKTQHCTLSNKPKRALGSNEQPGSAKKSLIQAFRSQHYRKHDLEHVSSIARAAEKRLGYLFRSSQPSKLLTPDKAQIRPRPSLESILNAVQRRAIRLIGDPVLTCRLQPLYHWRAVGDLLLFYLYSNGFCSPELTSIIPPHTEPARCTRGTSSSHPKAVVLHTSRTERYDRTFVPRESRA